MTVFLTSIYMTVPFNEHAYKFFSFIYLFFFQKAFENEDGNWELVKSLLDLGCQADLSQIKQLISANSDVANALAIKMFELFHAKTSENIKQLIVFTSQRTNPEMLCFLTQFKNPNFGPPDSSPIFFSCINGCSENLDVLLPYYNKANVNMNYLFMLIFILLC